MNGLRRAALLTVAASGALLAIDCGTHGHTSMTVHGTAIVGYVGSPIEGVKVFVAGQPIAPVVTDSNGAFVLRGVHAPYDLVLVMGTTGVTVYSGVTRPDPQAEVLAGYIPYTRSADIKGSISASDFPLGPNRHVVVAFGKPVNDGTGNVDPTTGAYTFGSGWVGPATQKVSFAALMYDDTRGDPSVAGNYDGFAMGSMTLVDGQTATGDLLLDTPVSTGHVPFVVSRPYDEIERSFGIAPTPGDPFDFPFFFGNSFVSTRGEIAVPMPIPPVPIWLTMRGDYLGGGADFVTEQVPSDLSTMTFDMPSTVTLVQPSNGASASVSQPFVLSGAEPQSVDVFEFDSLATPLSVKEVTAQSSVTIPDLSATGLTLGTSLAWGASSWGPAASVDDALVNGLDAEATPRRISSSTFRAVTLHP